MNDAIEIHDPVGGAGPRPLRLGALVVTYNRPAQLVRTLDALHAEGPEAILVVDNASTDGTAEMLAAREGVEVLRLPENRGGAGGFEAGLHALRDRGDLDWIVVMDDDARPMPGAFAAFRAADHTWSDAVAAAVELPGGAICDMNRPAVVPFWSRAAFLATLTRGRMGFHLHDDDLRAGAPPRRVDFASFVGLFLSRRALEMGGLPDGRMFIYGDDTLYTMELSRRGGRIVTRPEVRFEHDCRTMTAREGRHSPVWKVYYLQRNALRVYARAAGLLAPLVLPLAVVKWLLKVRAYGGERRAYLRHLGAALLDAARGGYALAPRPGAPERTPAA